MNEAEGGLPSACTTTGCGGDPRYAPPGRGHVDGCQYLFVNEEVRGLTVPLVYYEDGERIVLGETVIDDSLNVVSTRLAEGVSLPTALSKGFVISNDFSLFSV